MWSFLGLVPSKVSGLWTLVWDEDELENRAECTSLSMAMEEPMYLVRPCFMASWGQARLQGIAMIYGPAI